MSAKASRRMLSPRVTTIDAVATTPSFGCPICSRDRPLAPGSEGFYRCGACDFRFTDPARYPPGGDVEDR